MHLISIKPWLGAPVFAAISSVLQRHSEQERKCTVYTFFSWKSATPALHPSPTKTSSYAAWSDVEEESHHSSRGPWVEVSKGSCREDGRGRDGSSCPLHLGDQSLGRKLRKAELRAVAHEKGFVIYSREVGLHYVDSGQYLCLWSH